jgi:hypothetical protein
MPHLRERFNTIGFMGSGHTLDLQRRLPYDAVHDSSGLSPAVTDQLLRSYDVILTASDFAVADKAREQGLKVCIYDPLTWYWPELPPAARRADLYLAQDFYGVKMRLAEEFSGLSRVALVPPVAAPAPERQGQGEHVLINLGGLLNPHWPLEQAACYARILLRCLRQALPKNQKLVVAASAAVAGVLQDPLVKTYSVTEMAKLRQRSRVAFMTPGLGNIFDTAAENVPTVWLPPANDSQGQQANTLRMYCKNAVVIDWHDISPTLDIRYMNAQPDVIGQIAQAVEMFASSRVMQRRFTSLVRQAYQQTRRQKQAGTRVLAERFGTGGALKVAQEVENFCQQVSCG